MGKITGYTCRIYWHYYNPRSYRKSGIYIDIFYDAENQISAEDRQKLFEAEQILIGNGIARSVLACTLLKTPSFETISSKFVRMIRILRSYDLLPIAGEDWDDGYGLMYQIEREIEEERNIWREFRLFGGRLNLKIYKKLDKSR